MKWFVLLLLGLFLWGCDSKPKLYDLVVLADRSDSAYIPAPTAGQVRSLLPEGIDKQTGIHLRLRNIGESEYLPAYTLSLEPTSALENTIRRKIIVDRFTAMLDSLILRENAKEFSQDGSSILTVLIQELEVLSKSSAQKRSVLIYSDGYEFSHLINLYDPAVEKKLLSNPEEVAAALRPLASGLTLEGVNLHIIYYPYCKQDAERFRAIISFYRSLFEASGLTIHLGLPNAATSYE